MKRVALAVAVLTLMGASLAAAQTEEIGPRIGLSINPDQFVLGGQLSFPLNEPRGLAISPNLELGVGDNVTTIQFNGDVLYHFEDAGPRWNPYVGAGLGVAFYDFSETDHSDTETGVNLIGGMRFAQRSGSHLFTELRLGVGDVPDAKIMVGWNFPM